MDIFLQQVISGVAIGGIYALMGVALVMIFQASNHINFAQGEMALFSTYVAWFCISIGIPFWISFFLAVTSAFAMGFLLERTLIRPLKDQPVLSHVVVFIGLLVIFHAVVGFLFGFDLQVMPSPFPEHRPFGSRLITFHQIGIIGVTVLLTGILYLFLRFTPLGLAIRASAQNPVSSRLCGVPVSFMLSLGWGLAAAFGATAGILIAPVVFLSPDMMLGVLMYGFAAALLGGIDNPWGAVVGGVLVGLIENLAGAYVVGAELKLTVALAIIIGVLLVRPQGLFGRRVVVRV